MVIFHGYVSHNQMVDVVSSCFPEFWVHHWIIPATARCGEGHREGRGRDIDHGCSDGGREGSVEGTKGLRGGASSRFMCTRLEIGHLVRWFTYSKWWFSIVMLVYQRVFDNCFVYRIIDTDNGMVHFIPMDDTGWRVDISRFHVVFLSFCLRGENGW